MSDISDSIDAVATHLNCMEVWGGSESSNNLFSRPGLDVWALSHSQEYRHVSGGDLHFVSSCASGRITRMLMADVCAFGLSYKDIAAELRDLVGRNVNSIKQSRLVREISHRSEAAGEFGAAISAIVSTYFAPSRSFTLSNSGHPPPLLFRSDTAKWSILKAGAAESFGTQDNCQHFRTTLNINDSVLTYSNAIAECRDGRDNIIGFYGLMDRLAQIDMSDPGHVPSLVYEMLKSENDDNLRDGYSLFLCRATDRVTTIRDNLLAPFRLFRPVSDNTQIS